VRAPRGSWDVSRLASVSGATTTETGDTGKAHQGRGAGRRDDRAGELGVDEVAVVEEVDDAQGAAVGDAAIAGYR